VEYDPALLKGTVTIRASAALSDSQLWELLGDVLAARGLATTGKASGAGYSIVKIGESGGGAVLGATAGEGPRPSFGSVLVRVEHRPGKEVAEAVGKLLSKPGGSAVTLGDGGLLLISDFTSRLDRILEILRSIDVPGTGVVVEEIRLRNSSAQQLSLVLSQVSAKRDAVAGEKMPGDVVPSPIGNVILLIAPEERLAYWRQLIASLDQREPVTAKTYTPRYFAAKDVAKLVEQTIKDPTDDRWRLVIDDLTGSLVVTATPNQHEAIQVLLDRLASAPTEARRPVRTFVIKNRPVKDIQAVLEQLLQAGVIEAGAETAPDASHTNGASAAPQTFPMPPPPAGAPAPASGAAGRSNPSYTPGGPGPSSVGVSPFSPAGHHDQGTAFGSSPSPADRPLTLSSDEGTNTLMAVGEPRLLAQVEQLLKALDVRQPQVMLEVLMVTLTESQTLDLGVELDSLIKSGDLRIRLSSLFGLSKRDSSGNLNPGDPTGFTGLVLNPGDFAAVVHALQTISHGRSLSMPKLLVGNNQSASLDSVLTQPYASVNASTTIATTSYGGSQDAGTTVTIKPQIAEGDHLVLDYMVSLSSFVGSASAATLPPPKQQNKVQSAATIPDGFTVVVGGIELENDAKSVSQVPFLGNIPIVGEAFKTRNNSGSRSRFYVFIRANILRNRGFEDLKYISDRDVATAGVDDGLPKVEPRVIK
jgi:general secretion pathway protein D